MAKGVGLRLLSCRGSWVQIPPSALQENLWKSKESDFFNFGLWLKSLKETEILLLPERCDSLLTFQVHQVK